MALLRSHQLINIKSFIIFLLLGFILSENSRHSYIFYYPWYGNPKFTNEYRHWNHEIIGHKELPNYHGEFDIGADFYPELGSYSSYNPKVIDTHFKQIKNSNIEIVSISWSSSYWFQIWRIHIHREVRDLSLTYHILFAIGSGLLIISAIIEDSFIFLFK